jgi:hypothetical protein
MSSIPSDKDSRFRLLFGGPDQAPRSLRDLLEFHIDAVPAGGEIFWATYYFRDRALASALIRAQQRGVNLRVVLEAKPRTSRANLPVVELLGNTGNLGKNLRLIRHRWPDNLGLRTPRLHLKLYFFSHPQPHVLLGTFNPSGDIPEDAELMKEIGDQDRGHNYLIEIDDRQLVSPLRDHLLHLHAAHHGPWERFVAGNKSIITDDAEIYLFPRLKRDILRQKLAALPSDTHLRIAVSHFNDKQIGKTLQTLARRGAKIEILAHDTERRVPPWIENLLDAKLSFRRYRHPEELPMHNKFILIDSPLGRESMCGSMNFSVRSLRANHELLMVSKNSALYHGFLKRWEEMVEETRRYPQNTR